MILHSLGWLALAVLLMGSSFARSDSKAKDDFASVVKPFLASHCVKCHGEKRNSGKVTLHDLKLEHFAKQDVHLWGKIVEVLELAQMPPASQPQPRHHAMKKVTGWIKAQLLAVGKESDVDHKLRQPGFANLLNHEKLFSGKIQGPASSPPRLWRLHPEAYEAFLQKFGRNLTRQVGPLSKPFIVGEGKGLPSNYADLATADSATLGQLMNNCRQIAQLQTLGFSITTVARRTKKKKTSFYKAAPASFDAIMKSKNEPTEEQLRAAVLEEFQLVLLRKPDTKELSAFTNLLKKAIAIGGKPLGLRTMAMAILLRPEAIFRSETGLGKTDKHGRRMLSSHEMAHVISYALTDSPPEQVKLIPPGAKGRERRNAPSLMDLARNGKLKTREDVRRIASQIWDNEEIEKPRILRFFQEFFGYHQAGTVFKGDRSVRYFSARHLIKDADTLIMHIVKEDKYVLKELLTTDRYFFQWPGSIEAYNKRINAITTKIKKKKKPNSGDYRYFITRTEKTGKKPIPQANPGWRRLALIYNLNPKEWSYPLEQPFAMPKGERCGILTHPAWLVAWSGNFENDPIRRGKWIREHLLAGSVPEVPITVDATVPQDPHKTLRQRLTKTRDNYCWQCHQKMDPLGMTLESYTDFGRYRQREGLGLTKVLQQPKKSAPVDTSGEIIDSGEASLDGKVKNVHELMHKLAKSKLVRQSFVRHAFRFWMGRNETLNDSPTLIHADNAYVNNKGSFKELVLSLLTSDSFLMRK